MNPSVVPTGHTVLQSNRPFEAASEQTSTRVIAATDAPAHPVIAFAATLFHHGNGEGREVPETNEKTGLKRSRHIRLYAVYGSIMDGMVKYPAIRHASTRMRIRYFSRVVGNV